MQDLRPSSPVQPQPVDAAPRLAGDRAFREQARPREAPADPGVRVEISLAARESLARAELATRTLDRIIEALSLEGEQIDEARRESFLESLEADEDHSVGATADRIFTGIIRFVYDAFQLEHPDPTREQLEAFANGVLRGLDRGLRDAASLLIAFGARREAVAAERAETFEAVRSAVIQFANEQMRSDRPEPSAPSERATPDLFGSGVESD